MIALDHCYPHSWYFELDAQSLFYRRTGAWPISQRAYGDGNFPYAIKTIPITYGTWYIPYTWIKWSTIVHHKNIFRIEERDRRLGVQTKMF